MMVSRLKILGYEFLLEVSAQSKHLHPNMLVWAYVPINANKSIKNKLKIMFQVAYIFPSIRNIQARGS